MLGLLNPKSDIDFRLMLLSMSKMNILNLALVHLAETKVKLKLSASASPHFASNPCLSTPSLSVDHDVHL
jgi:hypothetical protein